MLRFNTYGAFTYENKLDVLINLIRVLFSVCFLDFIFWFLYFSHFWGSLPLTMLCRSFLKRKFLKFTVTRWWSLKCECNECDFHIQSVRRMDNMPVLKARYNLVNSLKISRFIAENMKFTAWINKAGYNIIFNSLLFKTKSISLLVEFSTSILKLFCKWEPFLKWIRIFFRAPLL